jgi:hypothetical protein
MPPTGKGRKPDESEDRRLDLGEVVLMSKTMLGPLSRRYSHARPGE